jgi:hypothetical protein
LNISYQSAKNYLDGRLPSAEVLLKISERTSYSIDWLLTGTGPEKIDSAPSVDLGLTLEQLELFVRRVCLDVLAVTSRDREDSPRVVFVGRESVFAEKEPEEAEVRAAAS